MIVAVWCGDSKPTDLTAYLDPFVTEMNHLLENGLHLNGKKITVLLRSFICDTPARAFLKGVYCFVRFQHIFLLLLYVIES